MARLATPSPYRRRSCWLYDKLSHGPDPTIGVKNLTASKPFQVWRIRPVLPSHLVQLLQIVGLRKFLFLVGAYTGKELLALLGHSLRMRSPKVILEVSEKTAL